MYNPKSQKQKNPQDAWQTLLRYSVFAGVLFLWALSVQWSASGLQAKNPENPTTQFIGYGLALFFTLAQLVFNRGSINPTIFIVGLFAYIYGISTNVIGILEVFNFDISTLAFKTNPIGFIIDLVLLGSLAFGIEVAPEAYLMWTLNPKLQRPGDFVSTTMKAKQIFNVNETFPKEFNYPARSGNVQNPVPEQPRSKQPKNEIVQYIVQYYKRHNKQYPSYRTVVDNTKLTSTNQVRPYKEKAEQFIAQNL